MTSLRGLLASVARIVFLRGSPERIVYDRRLFIFALLLAIAASAGVQALYFGDHVVFVILRVFAEITMFMLMIVFLTAKIARLRLAQMMLALVLISLMADLLLCLLSPLPMAGVVESRQAAWLAWTVGAVAIYGAANCVAWGLHGPLMLGLGCIGLYVAAAVGVDLAFRELYAIMAA